jgi:hypothetical protein
VERTTSIVVVGGRRREGSITTIIGRRGTWPDRGREREMHKIRVGSTY